MSTRQHVTHPVDVCGSAQTDIARIGSEKARLAALRVMAACMACGFTLDQAREFVAAQVGVAAAIVAHPEREAEIRREAARVTVGVVAAVRGRRAA